MTRAYRPTFIKLGERSEFTRSFIWDSDVEEVDEFARRNGFPHLMHTWETGVHRIGGLPFSARVYGATPGDYPLFLLTIDPMNEFHCVVCWDMTDLFEAMNLYGLDGNDNSAK